MEMMKKDDFGPILADLGHGNSDFDPNFADFGSILSDFDGFG